MKHWLKILFNIDNVIATIIIFIVVEHFTIYQNLDFLNPFINIAEDLDITDVVFSKVRNDGRYQTDTNIILVNIGNLNRKGIAKEIEIINKYKPAVVCVDVLFLKRKTDDVDIPLRNAFQNTNNLVVPSKLQYNPDEERFDSIITINPLFIESAISGFANVTIDRQPFNTEEERLIAEKKYAKTIRWIPTQEEVNGKIEYNLAANVVRLYAPEKFLKFKQRNSKLELINYKRNLDKYITFDVNDIFENDSAKLNAMRDKIVVVGFLGPDLKTLVNEDLFFSPLNPQYIGKSFPDMYGCVVHSNVISMIIDDTYFYVLPDWANDILKILIIYLMLAGLNFLRYKFNLLYEPLSITLVFISLVAWFVLLIYLFNVWNIYVELTDLFFYILLAVPIFELYQDSFKPMTLKTIGKITQSVRNVNNKIASKIRGGK